MQILVSTGATVTFKKLIEEVTQKSFIDTLQSLGVSKLFIQYGNEQYNKSQDFFESCIENSEYKFSKPTASTYSYTDSSGSFTIEAFPFSSNISEDYIAKVDLVVSHAGTGSIIDVLKLDKPLIVVVNESLMDNHQLEVATEFKKLGHCEISKPKNLAANIARIFQNEVKFNKFASNDNKVIQGIIYNEAAQRRQY